MIHPSELRIGNKLSKFNQETGTWQLITIGVKDIECAVNFPKVFAAFYEPIKLSPYYLEKLGFKYDEGMESYDLFIAQSGLLSIASDNSFFIGHDHVECGFAGGNKALVKYLHQLQNIYRDLSGTELDVPERL